MVASTEADVSAGVSEVGACKGGGWGSGVMVRMRVIVQGKQDGGGENRGELSWREAMVGKGFQVWW